MRKVFTIKKGSIFNILKYLSVVIGIKVLTITASYAQSLTGTYTIGISGDYTSFNAAITALSIHGVSGPVIFNVEAEAFEEQLSLTTFPRMSAVNTVTFRGHSSGNSTITYSPTNSNARHVILLDNAKHFVFDNLNILIGPNAAYGTAMLLMNSSDYNTVKNCHVEINNASHTKNFNGVLANATASGYLDEGNNANNFTFENNTVKGGFTGLRLNGSSTNLAAGNKIRNNHFYDYTRWGTYLYYQDAPEVTDNLIESSSSTEKLEMHHLELRYCDNDFKVLRNRIQFKTGIGLYVYYCNNTATTSMSNRGVIANNFISQGGLSNAAQKIYGVRINNSSNIDWVYNSINITGGNSADYAFHMGQGNASYTGYSLINNCFVYSGGGRAVYIRDDISSGEDFDFDYNNFYTTGPVLAKWGGEKADFEEFKSSYDYAKNQHSVSMDPKYSGVHDLHARSFQFCELGTPFARIVEDIDGDARSETTPDIGADEYSRPTTTYDVTFVVEKGYVAFSGAMITLNSVDITTDANGKAVFANIVPGSYDYKVTAAGCDPVSGTAVVENGNLTEKVTLADRTYFRIMSYNIKKCKNADEIVDIQATANVIINSGADIALLCEVDSCTRRVDYVDQTLELGRLTGMQGVFGKKFDHLGGGFGVAILSKYPIIKTRNVLYQYLKDPSQRTHTSLWATIVVGGDTIVAVSTHLQTGGHGGEIPHPVSEEMRHEQTEQIISIMKEQKYPVLFGGDLNEIPTGPNIQKFKEIAKLSDDQNYTFTYPAPDPVRKVDYIMMYKPEMWELLDFQVINETYVSDHRPLLATVKLKKSTTGVNHGEDVSDQQGNYLYNCYPNPMSGEAIVSFNLVKKCNVKIVLFNSLGQSVRVLENNDFQPGIHSVKFNKLNLQSGMYFVTMYSNEIPVDTKKIIISE